MTIGGMANVDRALLQSEWTLAHDETPECYCVSCGGVWKVAPQIARIREV